MGSLFGTARVADIIIIIIIFKLQMGFYLVVVVLQ
jgi:hypothetical protein